VGNGYDAQYVGVIEVNDGKRKAVKDKPLSSVQIYRPALGRLGNGFKSIRDRSNEFGTGIHTAFQVPVVRSLNLQPHLGVEAIRSTFWH
jgi:hypothetical protein